jgi:collagenase-like PrtC family protease
VEILVTESCLYRCPMRDAHYKSLAGGGADKPFHVTCNARKLTSPREFLLAGGLVRPEDTGKFEEMGVKYFKISGRSKPAGWLPEVVRAYQTRDYEGNLIRLTGIDPTLRAEEWVVIENKALEGYLDGFPASEPYEEQVTYADNWIKRLYHSGGFYLTDGSEYLVEGGELKISGRGGEKARSVIERELGEEGAWK